MDQDPHVENANEPQKDQPAPIINPDGTWAEHWLQHPLVPEDLRENVQLRTHKSLTDTLKNWAGLEKIRGAHVVPVPADGADDNQYAIVFDRLGRPEKPDGYTMPAIDDNEIPPEHRASDDLIAEIRQVAHNQAMLTDWQWQRLIAGWNKIIAGRLKAQADNHATAAQTALNPLRDRWRGQFGANSALAEKHARSELSPADFDSLVAMGGLEHPGLLEYFYRQASQRAESEPDIEGGRIPVDVLTAAEAELNKITKDIKGPYHQEFHPRHKEFVQKANELRALIERAKAQGQGQE